MLKHYFLTSLLALLAIASVAQAQTTGSVGIGTTAPDASAALDIVSSSKGLLLPRVAAASGIASPAPGLLVYQTGSPAGFYYNSGNAATPAWLRLSPADNLGNHTATQPLNLNGQKLTGGGTNGLRVRPGGGVVVDTLAGTGQGRLLTVAPDGTLQASAPIQNQALASSTPDPVSLSTVATPFAQPQAVAVNGAGTRAYVTGYVVSGGVGTGQLQAYDVSGSGAPVALGSPATTGFNVRSIAVNGAGTRAYVISYNNSTLQAFDLSGGSTPVALGGPVATGNTPHDLALNAAGTRAYVVSQANQLQAYDVSGSGAPVLLGSVTTGSGPQTVALNGAGTRAYLATYDNTLEAYDVSGSVPVALGSPFTFDPSYNTYPTQVAVNAAGTRAYLGFDGNSTGLLAFDLTGGTPALLGNSVATGGHPYDVAVNAAGTRAYVTTTGNALRAYDLSAGVVPVLLGSPVPTGGSPVSLALNAAGTRAYVANLYGGTLQVFSLAAPLPTVVGIGADGSLGTLTLPQLADNLGNHTATQNLNLAGYQLVSGGSAGLALTSAGNVGIGTTGPSQKLEVVGNVKITGSGNGLTFPDGSVQTSASALGNLTGDITSVGTATTYTNVVPATKGGAGTVSGLLKANGSGQVSAATPGTDYLTPATTGFIQNTATTPQAGASFNVANTGTVGGLLTAGSATVGGRVGIGTTPAQPATQLLDVRGNLRLGTDGGSSAPGTGQTIEFVGPGVNTDPVGLYRVNPAADQSELRVVVGDSPDPNDKFAVGRTSVTTEGGIPTGTFSPVFTVTSAGNVGIGTASPATGLHIDRPEPGVGNGTSAANAGKLGVLLGGGSSGNPSIELRGDGKSPYIDFAGYNTYDYINRLISVDGTLIVQYGIAGDNPPANIFAVEGAMRATAFNQTSDARFKQHVRPLSSALAAVLALRGVRYEWNALGVAHGGTAGAPQVGMLAQEVEKIYPELVSTDKEGYKAVNYAQLTPVLLEALKEQQTQLEALKQEVATAKAKAATAEADHAELQTVKAQAAADKAQATATLETFEARLRRLEASGAQAQR